MSYREAYCVGGCDKIDDDVEVYVPWTDIERGWETVEWECPTCHNTHDFYIVEDDDPDTWRDERLAGA